MKKIKKLLLLPILLLMTSCKESRIYVSSIITNKYDYESMIMVSSGKAFVPIFNHHYIFQFNEVKPYDKSVSSEDYGKYEIGEEYTFRIDEKEKEYFFNDSIVVVEEEK